jgi:phosphomannomutase
MQAIFKKYDLRGIVGEQFSIDDSYDIAKAIIGFFKFKYPNLKNIAIGMDGRSSSPAIKAQVCQAIIDCGFNAHFIGLCTTPALYFACNTLDVDAGIMITASHNPKEYNGFKLVLQKESIWGDDITKIYHLYLAKKFDTTLNKGVYREQDIINSYVDYLVDSFKHLIGSNLNFVIDCGNGSAGAVIPKLIAKLNWKNVKILYPEIDGNYPNHEPNPVELQNMLAVKDFLVHNQAAQFGIGLDGDCDRMAAMTKSGQLIPGDLLLGIFALSLKDKNRTQINMNPTIVIMDSKCSSSIARTLEQNEIKCYISPTGNAFIKSYMQQYQGTIGGELSGHYCFKDRHFGFDDGIYAMLRLCELLILTNNKLENLISLFPKAYCSPEIRITCTDNQKKIILDDTKNTCCLWPNSKIIDLDGVRVQTNDGWLLVRGANTEPAISIRIEGYSQQALDKLKLDLFEIIAKHIDHKQLINKLEL